MLEVAGVDLSYDTFQALKGVSLSVGGGEVMAVLGPSGSGKSSLLRVIAGLETPQRGRVLLRGEDITDRKTHLRRVGLMFQDYALFPHLTVSENVAFGLRMQRRDRRDIRSRVAEVLSWVDLEGFADRTIESLSGGEQQRVALARVLAPAPGLVMLDEPVGALDRALRARLVPELSDLIRRVGVTALYVTHDQDEAFAIADQVAILHEGRIRQVSSPDRLWREPATEFVARFLGFENFATVEVTGNGTTATPWGTITTDLPEGGWRVVIRPDGVRLDPAGTIQGRVTGRRFMAGDTRLELACRGTPLIVHSGTDGPSIGEVVSAAIDPDRVVMLAADR